MTIPNINSLYSTLNLNKNCLMKWLQHIGVKKIGFNLSSLFRLVFKMFPKYHQQLTLDPNLKCPEVYDYINSFLLEFLFAGFDIITVTDGKPFPYNIKYNEIINQKLLARDIEDWANAYIIDPIQHSHFINYADEPVISIMAPFEADLQLVYMMHQNMIDIIISDNNELLFFDLKHIVFLSQNSFDYYSHLMSEQYVNKLELMDPIRAFVIPCLLGNNYFEGIPGHTPQMALKLANQIMIPLTKDNKVDWYQYFINIYNSLDQSLIQKYTLASFNMDYYKSHIIKQFVKLFNIYYYYPIYNFKSEELQLMDLSYDTLPSHLKELDYSPLLKKSLKNQWIDISNGFIHPLTLEPYDSEIYRLKLKYNF